MKKLFTSFALLCFFALGAFAQGNYILTVNVVDTMGGPVANQQVCVYTDSMQTSFVYYNCVNTNSQGTAVVTIPGGAQPGSNIVFNVGTMSCNNYQTQQVQNNQGTTSSATVTFLVCNPIVSACTTYLYAIPDSSANPSNFFFTAYGTTGGAMSNIVSYSWDFGDGSPISTQASPQHLYAASGSYTACLTTVTNLGCSSSACTSFTIAGTSSCNAQFGYQSTGAGNNTYFNALFGANYDYLWSFGDGSSGTGQYPMHTYTNSGNYTVCLTVIDSSIGCYDNVCHTVYVPGTQPTHYVYGQVSLPGLGMLTPADYGTVYLIRNDSMMLNVIDTTSIDSSGYYFFPTVTSGTYLIKAALSPNSAYYAFYMPTYHSSSLFWISATSVTVSNAAVIANISMIPGANPGGPGFVGGSVLQGANRMASPGDPIVGITILLLDNNNNPIASTTTDSNGNYSFPNLAYGTYKVWAEIAGKTTAPSIVTINAANPTVNNVNVEVNSGNILGIKNATEDIAFGLYPNPASDFLTLTVDVKVANVVIVEIQNNLGQVVKSNEYKLSVGKHSITESLSTLSKGVYSISVSNNAKRSHTKFVKSE